ncbi:MAG TPA: NADP-dependent oxidoreductase [Propionicimonas sp.]|nr:NADP-dependent oxidoreductase [Propionicimonas sp.]
MKALLYDQYGGNDRFRIGAVSDPLVGPDSVLVKVVAAGLNPVDYKVREGYLQGLMQAVFPVVPGWDVAGIVVKVGLDTPEFAVGDEVLAYARKDFVHGGTVAELVEVPVRTAAHKPSGLGFEEAAALPLTGLTALQSVRRSGLTAGSTVLVHAAAGGVGSFATQLAVMAGARVIGTAGESNHDYLRELGAEPVAYGAGLVADAKALVPDGFDVILDYVGGQAIDTVPDLLRPGGSVVSIADGRVAGLGGTYAWVRPDSGELAELAALAASGRLKVTVSAVFDLDDAARAYASLEGGHTRGKIVVRV